MKPIIPDKPMTTWEKLCLLYSRKELARGYSLDKKWIVIAYTVEVGIIGISLIGAELFAHMYGHTDDQRHMMLLAPMAYGIVEFCRVPLAVALRIPAPPAAKRRRQILLKSFIFLALLGAGTITVKSVSQLGEIMFRPRLEDATRAQADMIAAESEVLLVGKKIGDSNEIVDRLKKQLDADNAQLDTATRAHSGAVPQCGNTSGTNSRGRRYSVYKCVPDPRLPALTEAVNNARAARNATNTLLTEATTNRKGIDRVVAETKAREAGSKYKEAVLNSQLHSFTGMVFGKPRTEVTDGEINLFLRWFVFVPAIGAAFSATLIAMASVRRLDDVPPDPPVTIELDDDHLRRMVDEVLDDAKEKTVKDEDVTQKAATLRVVS